ncbi:MAG: phosphatase PAP2 family protein [Rickettsiales bacterium]|jgi:membrane-associated phospholipid phosphatase|nr:phosphatase PAP2 family protein [Rickettsiales bacterium]
MFLIEDDDRIGILRTLAVLGAAALVAALGVWFLDYPLFALLRHADGWFWRIFAMFGAPKFILLASFLIFMFKLWSTGIWGARPREMTRFIMSGRSELLTAGAGVFAAVFAAVLAANLAAFAVGRLRPVFFESMNSAGFYPFSFGDQFNSMPSGYAAASFAALVLLGLFYPGMKRYYWAAAALFGFAGVVTGANFPSDILAGAFVGAFSAEVVYLTFKRSSES